MISILFGTIRTLLSQSVIAVDPDRVLEENDDRGDEVGEDLLQAEPQSHRETGRKPLHAVPGDTKHRDPLREAPESDRPTDDLDRGVAVPHPHPESIEQEQAEEVGDVAG
ncbi:MAG: hypothetical protein ACYTDE_07535, partial [Planctomycetota bacterium]